MERFEFEGEEGRRRDVRDSGFGVIFFVIVFFFTAIIFINTKR